MREERRGWLREGGIGGRGRRRLDLLRAAYVRSLRTSADLRRSADWHERVELLLGLLVQVLVVHPRLLDSDLDAALVLLLVVLEQ